MGKSVTRLFKQFHPETYQLFLSPDKKAMTFEGRVTIKGRKVGRPTQRLTLHAKQLRITKALLIQHNKTGDIEIPISRINLQKSYDELRLHSEALLYPGEYSVSLEFSSEITTSMTGLYPCFFEVNGQEHALLMTQFESHHAREVFPCIDEPEAKAVFELQLKSPKGEVVLANTPIATQKTSGEWVETSFEPSPLMSTYLLAFIIGKLHKQSVQTERGTEVNVWATVAQPLESLTFATDVAKQTIEFFEAYFKVAYPLAKADHVAVPDFSSGAMENWGLITYRERVLLNYPGKTSQSTREYIALVIAHETSHQWFGNLVTMQWWDDLWLNESFANMMEYEAVDTLFPEWHVWDMFVAQEGLSALRRDATPGVQAVKTAVHQPEEISTLFDPSIVYAKGGRLLKMMKEYIGEEAFRAGLQEYFKAHAYKNTTGADLWKSLSQASGIDVAAFMNPWLEKSGLPVVTIEHTSDGVRISQQHFLDNPQKIDTERVWSIPLFATDKTLPAVLEARTTDYHITDPDTVRFDSDARGHYIVNYTAASQRQALAKQVTARKLNNAERLMLLNDASMLARAGLRSYGDVLELLSAYDDETSESVWDMIGLIISELRRFVDLDEALESAIKKFVRQLIAAEYARLGWESRPDESVADQKLRATIIGLGVYAEEPAIVDEALQRFETYKSAPDDIDPELRGIIFIPAIKLQAKGAFEYLLSVHHGNSNSDLQADICIALTATRDPKEAIKLLALISDAKIIKPQDADRWLIYLMRNHYVGDIAWQWMVDNWQWIEHTYKSDKSYDMLPRYAASICNTKQAVNRYREFFIPKEIDVALKRNIQIGLEEIDSRLAWLERDLPSVQHFFTHRS